jgi:hypothetical protein
MKRSVQVLLAIGAVSGAALWHIQQSDGEVKNLVSTRIIQGPLMPQTTAGSPSQTKEGVTGLDYGKSPSGWDDAPATEHTTGTAVGFTTIGGNLYLVTALSPAAVALFSSTIADGGEPWFQCAKPAKGTATIARAVRSQFTGWRLRSRGGNGAVPPLPTDGKLLTPFPDSEQLICTLAATKGQ